MTWTDWMYYELKGSFWKIITCSLFLTLYAWHHCTKEEKTEKYLKWLVEFSCHAFLISQLSIFFVVDANLFPRPKWHFPPIRFLSFSHVLYIEEQLRRNIFTRRRYAQCEKKPFMGMRLLIMSAHYTAVCRVCSVTYAEVYCFRNQSVMRWRKSPQLCRNL